MEQLQISFPTVEQLEKNFKDAWNAWFNDRQAGTDKHKAFLAAKEALKAQGYGTYDLHRVITW